MSTITLNIGLDPPTYLKPSPILFLDRLQAAWWLADHHIRRGSGYVDKDTLVMYGESRELSMCLSVEAINQDCVAVWHHETLMGELIGPRAEDWGGFNPEHFKHFKGNR